MGEYGREQRNQLSRAVANNETGSKQLKGFVDNRKIPMLLNSQILQMVPVIKTLDLMEQGKKHLAGGISPDKITKRLVGNNGENISQVLAVREYEHYQGRPGYELRFYVLSPAGTPFANTKARTLIGALGVTNGVFHIFHIGPGANTFDGYECPPLFF